MTEDPSEAVCSATLGYVHSSRGDLFPTPDLAIDDAVTAWVEIAEETFFECPPAGDEIQGFAEAYEELALLQAEIEAVLEIERTP